MSNDEIGELRHLARQIGMSHHNRAIDVLRKLSDEIARLQRVNALMDRKLRGSLEYETVVEEEGLSSNRRAVNENVKRHEEHAFAAGENISFSWGNIKEGGVRIFWV